MAQPRWAVPEEAFLTAQADLFREHAERRLSEEERAFREAQISTTVPAGGRTLRSPYVSQFEGPSLLSPLPSDIVTQAWQRFEEAGDPSSWGQEIYRRGRPSQGWLAETLLGGAGVAGLAAAAIPPISGIPKVAKQVPKSAKAAAKAIKDVGKAARERTVTEILEEAAPTPPHAEEAFTPEFGGAVAPRERLYPEPRRRPLQQAALENEATRLREAEEAAAREREIERIMRRDELAQPYPEGLPTGTTARVGDLPAREPLSTLPKRHAFETEWPIRPPERKAVWMKPAVQAEMQGERFRAQAREAAQFEQQVAREGMAPPMATPSGRKPGGPKHVKPRAEEPPLAAVERALDPAEQARLDAGKLLRQTYDRIYPLRPLDKLAGIDPNQGSHATAQVVSGAFAYGDELVERDVLPLLRGVSLKDLEQVWFLEAAEDVVKRRPWAELPGGVTNVTVAKDALKKQLGERYQAAYALAEKLWKINKTHRLDVLRREGMIDDAQQAALQADHPHYLPFDRYEYQIDQPERLFPSMPGSVGGPDLPKMTKGGSTLPLDKPIARWIADLIHTQVVRSRNQAARKIVEVAKIAETVTGKPMLLVADYNTPDGAKLAVETASRGFITFYDPARPGIKQVANVPKDIAIAAKNLEAEPAGLLERTMKALAEPVRAGATAYSLTFIPRNIIRDLKTAYFREGLTPLKPEYWQAWKAVILKNSDFFDAARSGVLMSGFLENMRTTDALARSMQMRGLRVESVEDLLLTLPRLTAQSGRGIRYVGELTERSTRVATYLMLKHQGLSDVEAAVRARDVTVDFAKSGNTVRSLNMMVPFLNARLQGSLNTLRTMRDDPKGAVLRSAVLAIPTIGFYLWNQRFPTFNLIPSYVFRNNDVFQFGEALLPPDPKDPTRERRIPLYATLAKSEAEAIVTAPIEAMLRFGFANGDRSAAELFLEAAETIVTSGLPVDPSTSGLLALGMPPIAGTAAQMASGQDWFRGAPIVPERERNRPPEEQYVAETSPTAVMIGKAFKVSPRVVEFGIRSYLTGPGTQTEWMLDLALNALGYDTSAIDAMRQRELTDLQRVQQAPIVRGFFGMRATGQERRAYDDLKKLQEEGARAFAALPELRALGVVPGPVGDSARNVPLSVQDRVALQRRFNELAVERLKPVVSTPAFRQAVPDAQRQLVQRVLAQVREHASTELLGRLQPGEIERRVVGEATAPAAMPQTSPLLDFAESYRRTYVR